MITLDGCRTDPLGSYLQGLGAWRVVCRLLDSEATAHWRAGRLVLTSPVTENDLVFALLDKFSPLPLVSPWNAGSGFAGNGKSAEAERALASVRASRDPRLAELRDAILAADGIVVRGRALGWGGSGEDFWDRRRKADVVRLCRNLLTDAALPWLDAAVVLGQDADGRESLSYNRLLGTGGNLGRFDLQSTYVQRALAVLVDNRTSQHSEAWLRAALFGDESTPYLRDSVGQFDPGRAGGIQSSPREKADDNGFANPWAFLFTIEGTFLFASAATRRCGARSAGAAVPFVVRASTVGFGSAASGENAAAEIWTPQWDRPATLAEIRHLLGEGRAEWHGRPAQNGLDFVRAVASLGVDRGIRRFSRHVVVERLGQSPLAVTVDTVEVRERGGVGLLREVDRWLGVVRVASRPAAVEGALRRVDAAMYEVGRTGNTGLREALVALGHLHELIGKSVALSDRIAPLTLRSGWWPALSSAVGPRPSLEMRLAAAFASGRDSGGDWPAFGLRRLLSPVAPDPKGRLAWTGRPPAVSIGAGVVAALAEVHRRRARPGAVTDPAARMGEQVDIDRAPTGGDLELQEQQIRPEALAPAVKGTFSAFVGGLVVALEDALALASGQVDLDQLRDDLAGLLLLDWSTADQSSSDDALFGERPSFIPPVLALLLPFYASRPVNVRLLDEDDVASPLVLRPDESWASRLAAGDFRSVTDDAAGRLRAAGVRRPVTPVVADVDGRQLSAALLLRVPTAARADSLRQVADLPGPKPLIFEPETKSKGVPA